MTNSSPSYVLRGPDGISHMPSSLRHTSAFAFAVLLLAASMTGCGPKDGKEEFADGCIAYEAHTLEKAERLFEKSLEYAPNSVDAMVMLARVQSDLGKMSDALATITKAAELRPDDVDVALLDAEIAFWSRDVTRAIKRFTEVACNESATPEVQSLGWTGRGIVAMSYNKRDFARIAFLRAIRLDRRNPSARYHLGLLYRGDSYGYLDAALEQFEIFVRLGKEADPRAVHAQRVIIPGIKEDIARRAASRAGADKRDANASAAALLRGDAAFKRKRYATAKKEYEAAFKADVLSYPAALGLAMALEKCDTSSVGRRRALDMYKEACALRPSAVRTYITTGELAARLGQHATACEIYSRAVAANPSDISAIDGLIRALGKTGHPKEAAAYQRYRETIPVRRAR